MTVVSPEFRLSGVLFSIFGVTFRLANKVHLRADDRYWLEEQDARVKFFYKSLDKVRIDRVRIMLARMQDTFL